MWLRLEQFARAKAAAQEALRLDPTHAKSAKRASRAGNMMARHARKAQEQARERSERARERGMAAARPSLIPSLCTHSTRAGIEWRR